MMCDTCGSTDHDLDHCPYLAIIAGCCTSYWECYWCDALFCEHGYLVGKVNVKTIPWKKLCPKCQKESDEQD
jgi:hypothetical protein